ncbi:hypothetical protein QR680_000756 [Steinernema hermaphroditum]|uniref:Sterol regulatory element-binding protein cleavage-activating protein n=1 Tax=Steinernema hermaphroditum TaxID=289476 RepID=A0AA39GWH9_9BILA|nr:hypothetical protein QR680_000756 [Steinernema hermaphroditum]
MIVSRVDKYSRSLRERVSQAYYDYGRLCSSHPVACLSISIVTVLLLSYPAFSRFQLPISSPMDVHWSEQHEVEHADNTVPDWLYLKPSVYLQQIIVEATVEPWNNFNMTPIMAVRGALSRAFTIEEKLKELGLESINDNCLHVDLSWNTDLNNLLPPNGCMLLSPTAFWNKDITRFYKDPNILETIFDPPCSPSMCTRDILLGTTTRSTGIKSTYQTNRNRRIDYALTLFLTKYDKDFLTSMKAVLTSEFELQKSKASDESTFVHVFYRPRKYFADYFPLFISYAALMVYIYYSASKFVMVKSRWGLALAAMVTVSSTLLMTAGICSYFELTPTMWGAEWYPYLALMVGLENTLCITRSVVYTPPSLDVKSRLSHGLSQEGYSFIKYFLMEICFLFCGYVTLVPEIQEFCTFAFIGLVVDFYMQMFFYAPCLTFDLIRLKKDKSGAARMISMGPVPKLHEYRNITYSNTIAARAPDGHEADFRVENIERFGVSHRLLETAPLQWGDWQKKTFKWWPTVFGEYNVSLSGHYITFLPPVVLKASIPATDISIIFKADDHSPMSEYVGPTSATDKGELTHRVFWLEQQITVIMACSAVFLFSTVIVFILYVCFWGKWPVDRIRSEVESDRAKANKEYSRNFVESVPLIFSHHNFPIETLCVAGNTIISSCQEGHIITWDAANGEKLREMNRTKVIDGSREEPTAYMRSNAHSPPLIWSCDAKQTVAVFGCADGSLEICNYDIGIIIGLREVSNKGIVHVRVRGNRIVVCRLDGTIELLEFILTPDHPVFLQSLTCIWTGRAHQKAITCLRLGSLTMITASRDHTVKIFDIRTAGLLHTLQGHDAPVTSMALDHKDNLLFTSCEQGIICCWNMDDGSMKSSIESAFITGENVEMTCTNTLLVGFSSNGHLWLWDKHTGQAVTRITPESARENLRSSDEENHACDLPSLYKPRCIVTVHNDLVATSSDGFVQFWDLSYKIMIKQVSMPGEVDRLISIDSGAVICSCLNNMYRITVPVIRVK